MVTKEDDIFSGYVSRGIISKIIVKVIIEFYFVFVELTIHMCMLGHA